MVQFNKEKEKLLSSFYRDLRNHLSQNKFLLQKEDFVPIITYHLNNSVLDGGKRLRPILCFMMGKLFGLEFEKVLPFARIAEMIHAATLTHDDVIDESPRRRNRPTLHTQTTNTHAVLAGDYLLSEGINELCQLGYPELVLEMTNTLQALVQGEWLQLEAHQKVAVDFDNLEVVAKLKTASVMRWCCLVVPVIAKHPQQMVALTQSFGEYLGVAFQMVDDILDFKKDGEKGFCLDLKEGLLNFVALEIIEIQPAYQQEFKKLFATQKFEDLNLEEEVLEQAKQNILKRATTKITAAKEILREIYETLNLQTEDSKKAYEELLRLSDAVIQREK